MSWNYPRYDISLDPFIATTATATVTPNDHKIHVVGQASGHTAKLHTLPSTKIPSIQQAVVTPEVGPVLNLHYSKIPVRRPERGEVIVKIICTGVCRSDLSFSKGPLPGFAEHNHIAGHEGIGRVVASYEPSLLDRVVAARYIAATCNACWACLSNMPDACQNQKNFPKHYDGTFQEYVTAPWTSLMPLDPIHFDSGMSLDPAFYTAGLCSGAAALKALPESNIRQNDVVLIWGIGGGIGHLAGMMARKIFGVSVIGVDHAEKILELEASTRHQLCDSFVAAPKSLGDNDGFAAQVYKTCIGLRGGSFEPKQPAAIIVAASSEEPYRWINLVRDGGIVACLTVLGSTATLSVQIAEFVERQIGIKGVMMGGSAESYQVMQYIRNKRIEPIITKVALRDLPASIDRTSKNVFVGKLVVTMED